MFVWHGVGVIDTGHLLNAGETRLEVLLLPSQDDDTFAGVATRSPNKIILMRADGGWQAVFWTEQVDGSGFPVILAKDRRFGTDFRRKIVVKARDRCCHLLP